MSATESKSLGKPGSRLVVRFLVFSSLMLAGSTASIAQDSTQSSSGATAWLILQAIPSLSWTTTPAETNFAFEWEVAPVLYSWGMTRLVSPWHFFFVNQPERFAGSLELVVSGQAYVSRIAGGHTGLSGQLLSHFPLIEKGEYLGLNLGAARYRFGGTYSTFGVAGISTLFGFLHYNIKYSPADRIWMNSIEFRFF